MRVLLIDGYREHNTIVDHARTALEARSHRVSDLRLVDAGFDEFMSEAERRAYHEVDNIVTTAQRTAIDLIQSTDAVLVMSALRAGTVDPHVKSWLERVFIPEVGFTFTRSGRITGALKNVKRAGMIVDCPDADKAPHHRNGSTRSIARGMRLNASKTCRSSYLALHPSMDREAAVAKTLSRW